MLLWAFSGLFAWAALREIYYGFVPKPGYMQPDQISKSYLLIVLLIAAAFAYLPFQKLRFERFLTEKARVLSESSTTTVHCNTQFERMLSPHPSAAGYAHMDTGKMVLQGRWCDALRKHLRNPEKMDKDGIFSVHVFAHEAMHVRGEINEAFTDCQAFQRHYRAARLLGVKSDEVARKSGTLLYESGYKKFSEECAPGKALDEKLHDSTWN